MFLVPLPSYSYDLVLKIFVSIDSVASILIANGSECGEVASVNVHHSHLPYALRRIVRWNIIRSRVTPLVIKLSCRFDLQKPFCVVVPAGKKVVSCVHPRLRPDDGVFLILWTLLNLPRR